MVSRVRSLWRALRGRAAFEAEMEEEFRSHVALRTEDLIRSGVEPGEAARRARLEFGAAERYKEEGRASLGRTYTEAEEAEPVAVLSHGLWQGRFGGDPSIVGQTITLDDEAVTVLGVMHPDFPALAGAPQLWAPMEVNPEWRGRYLSVLG